MEANETPSMATKTEKNREAASRPHPSRVMNPVSGFVILLLDWLLFSSDVLTAGVSLPLTMGGGFLAALLLVACAQHFGTGDTWRAGLLKGLAAGIVVAVPFPIAGTFIGTGIIAMSGLPKLPPGK